ncbi:MAG: response regulator [Bdellovibrionia bacterium]
MLLPVKTSDTGEILAETSSSILIVEDEAEIRELIALHLLRQGYRVQECASVEEAQTRFKDLNFDLYVLDWMLPGSSGVDYVNHLRNQKIESPILMVTAKSEPQDIVEGLERGADDYVTKPFEPSILLARVKALLRRRQSQREMPSSRMEWKGLAINLDTYEVVFQGENLHFTPSEFKLLATMMQNRGKVLTREQLIEQIQGEGINVVGRTVDTHVFGLRKKLGLWGDNIETIRGVGYRVKMD